MTLVADRHFLMGLPDSLGGLRYLDTSDCEEIRSWSFVNLRNLEHLRLDCCMLRKSPDMSVQRQQLVKLEAA